MGASTASSRGRSTVRRREVGLDVSSTGSTAVGHPVGGGSITNWIGLRPNDGPNGQAAYTTSRP